MRRSLVFLSLVAFTMGCNASWNILSPGIKTTCVSWHSLHATDTTRSTTLAASHPDSVCTIK